MVNFWISRNRVETLDGSVATFDVRPCYRMSEKSGSAEVMLLLSRRDSIEVLSGAPHDDIHATFWAII